MKEKEWNETTVREQIAEIVGSSGGNKFALIYDPYGFLREKYK